MNKWLMRSIAVALLLAVAGALLHFARVLPETGLAPELKLAQRHRAVEECRQAARMVYDVHWAAACVGQVTQVGQAWPGQADGHAECDLPNEKAAVVNAWLDEAERLCAVEVQAGMRR